MQDTGLLQLIFQRGNQIFWQYRNTIIIPLALANHNLAPLKLHILHAQAQGTHQPHARAVEQLRNQTGRAVHMQ